MKQKVNYFFSVLLSLTMLGINCPVMALADNEITTKITHKPVEEAKAGKRILLEVEVGDKAGVDIVRVYFKAIEGAEYNFIVLTGQDGDYSGKLPAPANGAGGIDYLVLVKNGNNKVVKSQTFRVVVKDDDNADQSIIDNDKINVYTELTKSPAEITGFSDNIAVDVVESAAKLGVAAGLYSTSVAGASTSAATAGGTVTASTGGFSTTTIVGGTVATAAIIGGIAAGSGGGGGDGGDGGDGDEVQELNSQTILGIWNISGSRLESTLTGATTFYDTGRLYSDFSKFTDRHGNWSLEGTSMFIEYDISYDGGGAKYDGIVIGNAKHFRLECNNGWIINYSR